MSARKIVQNFVGILHILRKIVCGCQDCTKLVVLADVFLDLVRISVLLTRQSLQSSSFKATNLR